MLAPVELEARLAGEAEAVDGMVDGQGRLEDLLVAPGGLEVPVAEVGLEEVAMARVVRRLERLVHRPVLFRDVELLHVEGHSRLLLCRQG